MAPATFLLGGDIEIRRLGHGAMRLCAQPGNFGTMTHLEENAAASQLALLPEDLAALNAGV